MKNTILMPSVRGTSGWNFIENKAQMSTQTAAQSNQNFKIDKDIAISSYSFLCYK